MKIETRPRLPRDRVSNHREPEKEVRTMAGISDYNKFPTSNNAERQGAWRHVASVAEHLVQLALRNAVEARDADQ